MELRLLTPAAPNNPDPANLLELELWKINIKERQHKDQSCILLAKNGRQSISKRTKHINLRYFFVKDKVDSGDMVIHYCPTEDMYADFFTKALQGNSFLKHRYFIMNVDPAYYDADPRSVLKSDGHTPDEDSA
jgi:hypothetical protein